MMHPPILALIYTALAACPFAMHLGVAAGAPWGRFTVGGRFSGQLPPLWRGLACLQAGLLMAMACAVLDRGGVIALDLPPGAFWVALALTLLSLIANAASPSRPERLLWTPVIAVMAAAALGVAFL